MTTDDLDTMKESTLLHARIRDLPIAISGTPLEKAIAVLYDELNHQRLTFRPECYLADEWFSPNDEPVIGIPFYLAHPRLIALEEKMMLEAEGASPDECSRLLRHEAAHALSHAYALQRWPAWRRCFGNPKQPYAPELAKPRLYSRRYVTNLEKGYAQSHPDEDWAETFAVWLNPHSRWATVYRGWPALKKLQVVDRLMTQVRHRALPTTKAIKICQAAKMTSRLSTYYAKKKLFNREQLPDFFDADLTSIFSRSDGRRAADFLQDNRRRLILAVSKWTNARRYTIDHLLSKLIRRCEELKLDVQGTHQDMILTVSSYLTSMASNYLLTGKLKRT